MYGLSPVALASFVAECMNVGGFVIDPTRSPALPLCSANNVALAMAFDRSLRAPFLRPQSLSTPSLVLGMFGCNLAVGFIPLLGEKADANFRLLAVTLVGKRNNDSARAIFFWTRVQCY